MKITHCKLLRKQQLRLIEFFVLEVTARSAVDMMEIQANTAILFYRKLRKVIAYRVLRVCPLPQTRSLALPP